MDVVATQWGLGRRDGDEVALVDLPYRTVRQVILETGSLREVTMARVRRRIPTVEALTGLLPPLPAAGTAWGVGLNYRGKARLTGRPVPAEPILYCCAASALAGPGDVLPFPEGCTEQLDAEAEIAVIVGRRLYRADERDVWAAVAGITAANDVTARDVMRQTGNPTLAKSFPGCTPLGASVRPADEITDPQAIGVRGRVDGVVHQDGNSADMIWSIGELLARVSWFAALLPGDVLLTGTPAGTGQDRGSYLRPGSTVTVEVDGVLPLHTTIGTPDPHRPPPPTDCRRS